MNGSFGVETDCIKQAISYKRSGYLTTVMVVLHFGLVNHKGLSTINHKI